MKIALMVEGVTEEAFMPYLNAFLTTRLAGSMPRIRASVYHGPIYKEHKLRREVRLLLAESDAVVALTDVYTGAKDFTDAADAKAKMRDWVGPNLNFHPHAAQHEFEAWLLPFWERIKQISGCSSRAPSAQPERVNHGRPPSKHIAEAFRIGGKRSYVKPRDARKILDSADLNVAAQQCPELKAFLNTFLTLCGGTPLA